MGVTIHGLSSLQAKFTKLDPVTYAAMSRGVQLAGLKVEGDAKNVVPVDTGALKGSITTGGSSSANSVTATVGSSLEYAPYVELGTSKNRAQPYLQPSLQRNKKTATKIVLDEIRNAYKGL